MYIGATTSVNGPSMFISLVQTVLLPVVVGSIVSLLIPKLVEKIKPLLEPAAIIALGLVMMGTMSNGAGTLIENIFVLPFILIACILLGLVGLASGYFIPKYLGFTDKQRIAASFEVGIQNAAVAPTIASMYFGPLAILPAIIYGKTQNILAASIFVPFFRKKLGESFIEERAGSIEQNTEGNVKQVISKY